MRRAFLAILFLACAASVSVAAATVQVQLSLSPNETLPGLPVSLRLSVTNLSSRTIVVSGQTMAAVTDSAGATRTDTMTWIDVLRETAPPYAIKPGATLELLAPLDEFVNNSELFLSAQLGLWRPGDYTVAIQVLPEGVEPVWSNQEALRVALPTTADAIVWRKLSNGGTTVFVSESLLANFDLIADQPESLYFRYLSPFVTHRHYVAEFAAEDLDAYATRMMEGVQDLPGPWVDAARISLARRYESMARRFSGMNAQAEAAEWSTKGRVYAQQLIDSPGSSHGALLGAPLKAKLHTLEEWRAEWDRIHAYVPPDPSVTPSIQTVAVHPSIVVGGTDAAAVLTLSGPAPAGGIVVTLSSTDSAASLPATAVIAEGELSATLRIDTRPVPSEVVAVISATLGATSRQTTLVVRPPKLDTVSLNMQRAPGGSTAIGTVALDGVAPPSGVQITLACDSSSATVPSAITIPSGATSAEFHVAVLAVAVDTTVSITATAAGASHRVPLIIEAPVITAVSVEPTSVTGGTNASGTITLTGPAPSGGFPISLATDRPEAAVPSMVTIGGGAATANFSVTTISTPTAIRASITATANGIAASAELAIFPVPIVLRSITVSTSAIVGGLPLSGIVTLNDAAPAGGAVVSLLSDDAAIARVPDSVSVPAGSTTATFHIETTTILAKTSVLIRASYAGVEQTAEFDVIPPTDVAALSLVVDPPNVAARTKATATVNLTGPAPQGGAEVDLTTSNSAVADVPKKIRIRKEETSDTFKVTTRKVASPIEVTLTASYGGLTQKEAITVVPESAIQLQSVTVAPPVVVSGGNAAGTVVMSAAAPTGGLLVTLRSSRKRVARVPQSTIVPGGATASTFPITVGHLRREEAASIKATYAGVTKSTILAVQAQTGLAIESLTIDTPNLVEGSRTTATVRMNGPAPSGGVEIVLTTSEPAKLVVPSRVRIAPGTTSAPFEVRAKSKTAPLDATVMVAYHGSHETAQLTIVAPHLIVLSSLVVTPPAVAGGANATGTVTISSPAPRGGIAISLRSLDRHLATLPDKVVIAEGETYGSFVIATSSVPRSAVATIRVSWAGSHQDAILTVTASQ